MVNFDNEKLAIILLKTFWMPLAILIINMMILMPLTLHFPAMGKLLGAGVQFIVWGATVTSLMLFALGVMLIVSNIRLGRVRHIKKIIGATAFAGLPAVVMLLMLVLVTRISI